LNSNPFKARSIFDFSFKFRCDSIQVVNIKVAPDNLFYHMVKLHIFQRHLAISFDLILFLCKGKMIKSNLKSFFISYRTGPVNPTRRLFTLQPKPSSSTRSPCRAERPRGVHAVACCHALCPHMDKTRPCDRAVQAKRTICVLRPAVRSAATSLARPTATTRRAVVSSSRQPSSYSRSPSQSVAFTVVSSAW
jgi:hypothetical protein